MEALPRGLLCQTSGDETTPIFDSQPSNVTTIKGQPAVLPCTVTNKESYLLVWMNPRRVVLSSNDRRVIDDTRMSIERPFTQDWNLHIRNVQINDAGEYTCQINTNPIQIKRIRLTVHVPAQIENETTSGDITVREGEKVMLQCVANGIPEPSITWYRNTPQTNQTRQLIVNLNDVGTTGEQLIIHNITRFCGGVYECEANNNIAPPVRRAMNVNVAFSPEVSFRTPLRMSQKVGHEVMFECFVSAFPHGMGQWTKDGKPVGSGAEHPWRYRSSLYMEDSYTYSIYLRILNVEPHDFGTYTCEASNNLGADSASIIFFELLEATPPPTRRPIHPNVIPGDISNQTPYQNGKYPKQRGEINSEKTRAYKENGQISGYVGAGDTYDASNNAVIVHSIFSTLIYSSIYSTIIVLKALLPS
ncbi:Hemicentin-1 [Mactra antiquata]